MSNFPLLLEDFKSKLADIGLDSDESKQPAKAPTPQKSPLKKANQAAGTPTKNSAGSIYSIINKNKNSAKKVGVRAMLLIYVNVECIFTTLNNVALLK